MGAGTIRTIIFSTFVTVAAAGSAAAQTASRPPVGGFGSPPDAMIFYVARGAAGACGQGCSEWIAAEGTVQWDTHKRLIAILDRQAGRKLPVVIRAWGQSNLNVATSLGRILRDRGIDTTAGSTEVEACGRKSDTDCFALKRPGGPLDARMNLSDPRCDIACVLVLAGGVHRSLPTGTRMILTGMAIRNRLAPNVSDEQRESSDSAIWRTVPPLSAGDGPAARTARYRRAQFGLPAGNGIAAIGMGQAADRHRSGAVTTGQTPAISGRRPHVARSQRRLMHETGNRCGFSPIQKSDPHWSVPDQCERNIGGGSKGNAEGRNGNNFQNDLQHLECPLPKGTKPLKSCPGTCNRDRDLT